MNVKVVKKMSKSLEQEATNYMKNLAEVKMRLEMNRDSLKLAKEELTNECVRSFNLRPRYKMKLSQWSRKTKALKFI